MSKSIIDVVEKSENCINCKHSYSRNTASGFECSYPCLLIRILFGRRPVKANDWCKRFDAIRTQKTR